MKRMKDSVFVFLILLFSFYGGHLCAQQKYNPGDTLSIMASAGLNFRDGKGLHSNKISILRYAAEVVVVKDETPIKKVEYDGIQGQWILVNYYDRKGYVFDGYLSKIHAWYEFDLEKYFHYNFDTLGKPQILKTYATYNDMTGHDTIQLTLQQFKNGASITNNRDFGGIIYVIPNMTFEEAFLLARITGVVLIQDVLFSSPYKGKNYEPNITYLNIKKDGKGMIQTMFVHKAIEEASCADGGSISVEFNRNQLGHIQIAIDSDGNDFDMEIKELK